jgi:sporulation protein YlmC with PRC-barrel domain
MKLALGTTARCSDGAARELADIVVDAPGRRVTHLVVQPKRQHDEARLVPLELAGEDANGGVSLFCTAETLDGFERVREYAYLPAGQQPEESAQWDVGVEDVLVVPSVEPLDMAEPELDPNVNLMYDRVPKGEVELRLTSSVYSADEHRVGSVNGVVVGENGGITALTLQRGHLWWRREISVPVDAIASLENDVATLAVEKSELKQFPSQRGSR